MADRHTLPKRQKTFAANAAFFVMAAIFAVPALAATSSRIPCSEADVATLNVPVNTLITTIVSHDFPAIATMDDAARDEIETVSSASLLAPRAEAAIRDAFKEIDSAAIEPSDAELAKAVLRRSMAGTDSTVETTDDDDRQEPVSGMNTKLPGISDDASSRYKKQMFRRDI